MINHGRKLFFALVVALSLTVVAEASAFELGARAYLWFPDLKKADVQTIANGIEGSDISATDMLGVGNKITYSVEAYGGFGKNHISLMYTPFGYTTDAILATALTYNGIPYNTGDTVHTDMGYSMFDLKYQRDLINLENVLAGFSLGGIAQIKYSTGSFKLNSAGKVEQDRSFNSIIPMIGVGAHIGLLANLLEARAQVTAGGYSSENYSYEAMADVSLTPFPFLDIHAGYRLLQQKMDVNDYKMDTLYSGPYIGLSVGF